LGYDLPLGSGLKNELGQWKSWNEHNHKFQSRNVSTWLPDWKRAYSNECMYSTYSKNFTYSELNYTPDLVKSMSLLHEKCYLCTPVEYSYLFTHSLSIFLVPYGVLCKEYRIELTSYRSYFMEEWTWRNVWKLGCASKRSKSLRVHD
jgi:hypothetical protein